MQRAIGTTTDVNGEKNVNPGTTCFQRLNNHVLVRLHHRILQVQARTVTTKSVSYSTEEQSIRERLTRSARELGMPLNKPTTRVPDQNHV